MEISVIRAPLKTILSIYRNMIKTFYTIKVKYQCKSYGSPLSVNFKSSVTSNTVLHKNVNFNGMQIKGSGKVIIGNNFHSGQDCLIISDIHNYDKGDAIPYDNTYIANTIIIKDNVWIGDRVTIIGNVTIDEGAIIQAGSVVVKDIPKYSIAGGHPAVVFKHRDIDHYEGLKKMNRFL